MLVCNIIIVSWNFRQRDHWKYSTRWWYFCCRLWPFSLLIWGLNLQNIPMLESCLHRHNSKPQNVLPESFMKVNESFQSTELKGV